MTQVTAALLGYFSLGCGALIVILNWRRLWKKLSQAKAQRINYTGIPRPLIGPGLIILGSYLIPLEDRTFWMIAAGSLFIDFDPLKVWFTMLDISW